MICTLIAAAELNDRFREEVLGALERGKPYWNKARADYTRDKLISRIATFSYRLGVITATDLDNLDIFGGIQEVFHKTKTKMDEGII